MNIYALFCVQMKIGDFYNDVYVLPLNQPSSFRGNKISSTFLLKMGHTVYIALCK